MRLKAHAAVRERQTSVRTLEERRPDIFLKFRDPPAQRRLRNVQLLGRPRDVAGAAHGEKGLQYAKVHSD